MAEASRVMPRYHPEAELPVLSASIDWLTATVSKPVRLPFAEQAVTRWQTVRAADGYPTRPYVANGYSGTYVDGITWGERGDGAMIRLSGEMAKKYATQALMWAENVTRVDFQITVQDDNAARDWATMALAAASHDKRIESGLTKWETITSSAGGSTLYIGRRSSSRLLRAYNKSAESEGLWPATSWRFEVEYKPPRSERWATKVRARPWTDQDTRDVVALAFGDYGFAVPCRSLPRGWKDQAPREPTTDERKLAYLRQKIKPMILKLKESYDIDIIAEAIGFYDWESEVGSNDNTVIDT